MHPYPPATVVTPRRSSRYVTMVAEDIWVHILRVGVAYLTYTT